MRVFVALACPPELLPAVSRYRDLVAGVPGVRVLEDESLHLTLIPPWEEKDPDAVVRDFAAVSSPPVTLSFDAAEERRSDRGGLIWIRGKGSPELERLSLQAWRAIKSHDPPRPVLPHVTVARFPEGAALPAIPPLEPVTATLGRLCLYGIAEPLTYRILGSRTLG